MCMVDNSKTIRVKKPKQIWKVVQPDKNKNDCLLWRQVDGRDSNFSGHLDKKLLSDVLGQDAIGFDEGYGFMCFEKKTEANKYLKFLKKHRACHLKELVIPKGARFVRGTITKGIIGEGTPCLRAEKIDTP